MLFRRRVVLLVRHESVSFTELNPKMLNFTSDEKYNNFVSNTKWKEMLRYAHLLCLMRVRCNCVFLLYCWSWLQVRFIYKFSGWWGTFQPLMLVYLLEIFKYLLCRIHTKMPGTYKFLCTSYGLIFTTCLCRFLISDLQLFVFDATCFITFFIVFFWWMKI